MKDSQYIDHQDKVASLRFKLYYYFIWGLVCLITHHTQAQNNTSVSDSLFYLLKQARKKSPPDEKQQLILLNKIGEQLLKEGSNDALKYIRKALVLGNKTNHKADKLHSLVVLGLYYQHNNRPQKAIEYFKEALNTSKKNKFHLRSAEVSLHLGECYRSFNEIQTSIFHYFEAASFYRKIPNYTGYIKAINQVAGAFYDIGEHRKSLKYFLIVMKNAKKLKKVQHLVAALNNAGSTYTALGSFDKALEYLQEGLTLSKANKKLRRIRGALLSSIGEVYLKQNNNQFALKYFKRAWRIAQEVQHQHLSIVVSRDLAQVYAAENRFEKAITYERISLKTAQKSKDIHQIQLSYSTLSNIYKKAKDFENALLYYDKYHQLHDSSQHNNQLEAMRRLELKHQNLQKEQEIKLLTKEKEIQKNRFNQKQKSIYLSIIICLVLLIPSLLYYRHYRNKRHTRILFEERNKIIALQNEKIKTQTYHLQRKNEELNTKNQELIDLNQEKNLMVGGLAHDLRSPLNQVKGLLQLTQMTIPSDDETANYVSKALQSADRLRDMIDRILDLKMIEEQKLPLNLENIDVYQIIHEVVQSFASIAQQKSIVVHLAENTREHIYQIHLDKNYTLQVFENLLSNALKFSPVNTQVWIDVGLHKDKIRIIIKDEGPGISPEDQTKLFRKFQQLSAKPTGGEASVGLGLSIVKKFVEAMNGGVWCESVLGKGTSFIVEFSRQE